MPILTFITYQLIQLILLPLFPLYTLMRTYQQKPLGSFTERIGFVQKSNPRKKTIWIHTASVGETLATQELIKKIKKEIPHTEIYLTTGTITGKEMGTQKTNADYVNMLPFDFLPCVALAYKRIKPSALIIIEADVWPNLVWWGALCNIPIHLINGRLKKQTEKKYYFSRWLLSPVYNSLTKLWLQTPEDKERFARTLTIKQNKMTVMGELKAYNFYTKHQQKVKESSHNPRTILISSAKRSYKAPFPTLLAGSVHPGEIDIVLSLFKKVQNQFPNAKLIVVPRHFHWQHELEKKLKKTNNTFVLWDEQTKRHANISEHAQKTLRNTHILAVCRLGDLFSLYQVADLYILGGTFVPIGGHNALEPAAWSVPTIVGPHYQNSQSIIEQLAKVNGLKIVYDTKELTHKVIQLLHNQKILKNIGGNAHTWLHTTSQTVAIKLDELIAELRT